MWSVSQYIWAGSPPFHRPTMEFWESCRCEHSQVQLHQFQQYHPSSRPHQAAIPKCGALSFPRDEHPLSWPAECFGRHSGSDFSLYRIRWQPNHLQGVAEVHHLQTVSLGAQDYKWGRGKLRLDIKQQFPWQWMLRLWCNLVSSCKYSGGACFLHFQVSRDILFILSLSLLQPICAK